MAWYWYLIIAYLIVINIVSLIMYIKEGMKLGSRLSALGLILLPIMGGSFGACIANYFCDTEYRELRVWLHKFLAFLPPIMFFIQLVLLLNIVGLGNAFMYIWHYMTKSAGWIGGYLLVVNIIGFFLVIIRKASYYIAPMGNFLIPDLILIPILVLGGATGGVIAKILFNFKEDWSCNSTMEVQNFIYNIGMFIISFCHIGLYVFFIYFR